MIPIPVSQYIVVPAKRSASRDGARVSLTIGMVSARFRDIPRIIASLAEVVFLITPIIWTPDLLGPRIYLAYGNPFFHMIEIVRAPLLGHVLRLSFSVATCFRPEILLMDEWILAGDAHFMGKAEARVQSFIERASDGVGLA